MGLWGKGLTKETAEYLEMLKDGRVDKETTEMMVRRTLRGGSWRGIEDTMRCTLRIKAYPWYRGNEAGFRILSPVL